LTIKDEGEGIPPEHLGRLTERFYRVDTSRSRSLGGTGLGLSIVKHIVERHRGRLIIESELGQGTTGHVLLPMANDEQIIPPP
jgi:two-component system phosphate regulon sensor histidine kinase PhoR